MKYVLSKKIGHYCIRDRNRNSKKLIIDIEWLNNNNDMRK